MWSGTCMEPIRTPCRPATYAPSQYVRGFHNSRRSHAPSLNARGFHSNRRSRAPRMSVRHYHNMCMTYRSLLSIATPKLTAERNLSILSSTCQTHPASMPALIYRSVYRHNTPLRIVRVVKKEKRQALACLMIEGKNYKVASSTRHRADIDVVLHKSPLSEKL